MSISLERIQALSLQTGFGDRIIEKVVRLGEILGQIRAHRRLSQVLLLKGGTALNLCFGEPMRLSVDLDFNYVGALERELMLQERPDIEAAISHIARGQRYRVQWSTNEHAGRKAFLAYENASGSPDRIGVDLNYLFRTPLSPPGTRMLWQPGDLVRPTASVVGLDELAVGKLIALLDRATPRDLFDAARLPKIVPEWGTQRMRRLFVALAGVLDHPLERYGRERFDRLTSAQVRQQLHPMLLLGEEPSAEDLKAGAWMAIEPLLRLDPAEHEYTDRIQRGEFAPELLFPDDSDLAATLRRHPALLWKAHNARQHARRGPTTPRPTPKAREER